MKVEAAVRHKLRQVLFRHLKRSLATSLQKLPHTCIHNGRPRALTLPRLCLLGAGHAGTWAGVTCDADTPGGVEQAKACPYWEPRRTKDEIKAAFKMLVSQNPAAVAAEFPDAAALMWVLDNEAVLDWDLEDPDPEVTVVAEDGSP